MWQARGIITVQGLVLLEDAQGPDKRAWRATVGSRSEDPHPQSRLLAYPWSGVLDLVCVESIPCP